MFGIISHRSEIIQLCRFLSRNSNNVIKMNKFKTTVFGSILVYKQFSCNINNYVFYLSLLDTTNLRGHYLKRSTGLLVLRHSTSTTPSSGVSLSHMKRILQMKNLDVKDGFTCLSTRCIFCQHENNNDGDLYINKVTGYFLCTKCRANGSWDTLENALSKNKIIQPPEELDEPSAKWASISEKSIILQSLSRDKVQEVIDQFKFKDNYEEILFNLKTLVNSNGTCIYIPICNGKQIVGVKELTPDGRETSVPNRCKGVIMIESSKKKHTTEEAIVVQSVKDMLALSCLKLPYDVISLPHGIDKLPQEVLPILEHYKRIVLWFGNMDGHWYSARHFAKKLNEQRCSFVRPTDDHPAPYKAQQDGLNLLAILNSAMPVAHKSITNFTYLREDVLSHLQNVDKAAGVKWSRFPALNKILKGHRRGEMTILTGPSGSGKTTFMSEYSLDLAMQGVTTLWGSFEIRNERLARTMLQQLCQFPLHLHLDKFNKWADIFQQLPIYFMTFFGQQPLKTVLEAVEHAAYVYDISHVIIDNVQFMMGHSETDNSLDRFHRQDAIVGAFRNFATTANCHVTLVIHPRKEKDAEMLSMNSVFGGAKATQEADNVFIIQQKTLPNLKLKKYLQIAKNRYCGDLGVMPLEFDKEALSFIQKSAQKNERPSE